jgi:hypothetical protein
MAITLTKTGYGDVIPATGLGRIFAGVSCLLGSYLTTLLIASVMSASAHQTRESVTYTIIRRQSMHNRRVRKLADLAAYVIGLWFRV